MTKKRLIEKLKDLPDDANICVWNEKERDNTPVTDVLVFEKKAYGYDVQVHLCSMW